MIDRRVLINLYIIIVLMEKNQILLGLCKLFQYEIFHQYNPF